MNSIKRDSNYISGINELLVECAELHAYNGIVVQSTPEYMRFEKNLNLFANKYNLINTNGWTNIDKYLLKAPTQYLTNDELRVIIISLLGFKTTSIPKHSTFDKEEHEYMEYVDSNRILELENISTNSFDLIKLIQFCKELNYAYNKKSYLTIPLLVRAIIDHIPPIFGKENFAAVCGGHGASSFQKSMNHLHKSLRNIADSTIHVQIRNREILPNETQINFKADLDVLLAEICRVLK